MNPEFHKRIRTRESGQTIVIALIVLGLLLILGFVFLGIINRNIQTGGTLQRRSVANDLAEAGIRYAHSQLLQSEAGADWHGVLNGPAATTADPSRTLDPDALFLRPPATNGNTTAFAFPGTETVDRGGPDGLGPYFRVNFDAGRALVRVRYAPSDANIFASSPTGPLRNPGQVRNYLIIESVGRAGSINPNDPTTLSPGQPRQFRNFASQAQFEQEFAQLRRGEAAFANNRKVTAMASIGITDTARFIHNKHNVTRPADIGVPKELGAQYRGNTVSERLSVQLGLPSLTVPFAGGQNIGGLGSVYSNADLRLHGTIDVYTNGSLGDRIVTSGTITPAVGAQLRIFNSRFNPATQAWTPYNATNPIVLGGDNLNSRNGAFSTAGGLVIDGVARPDADGYSRGAGYKTPPSIDLKDPETGETRYVQMTRESGGLLGNGNSGRYGHGRGVYVDNFSDRQVPRTEAGRQAVGEDQSEVYDWLNPNNGQSRSGWVGPYYIPYGAHMELLSDGFTITRDGRSVASERFWRLPNGNSTGNSSIRYRIGRGTNGGVYIVNSNTSGISNINAPLAANQYDLGFPFNGVVYFEGNVRVRGVIPTDVQMTVVTRATLYIEGSITKGVTGNHLTATLVSGPTQEGSRLNRPSRSMLGLFARDFVTLNTTMLFGPSPQQALLAAQDVQNPTNYNPIRMQPGRDKAVNLQAQFVLDPFSATPSSPDNPSTWQPFATGYEDAIVGNRQLVTKMLLTHAMDDGPGTATYIATTINSVPTTVPVTSDPTYYFPATPANAAAANEPAGTQYVDQYGLGAEPWQRYPRFESTSFTLVDPNAVNVQITATDDSMYANEASNPNRYRLFNQAQNDIQLIPGTVFQNDYLLARSALAPFDVRIEATIFAEEGSFFVIPGPWFNPNPNDRRDVYQTRYEAARASGSSESQAKAVADDARLTAFGASSDVPFYGEPLDVRIVIRGAVAENMPPPISQQAEWIRKWGWIPGALAASGNNIPGVHVPQGHDLTATPFVPNLLFTYDPVLATARTTAFANTTNPETYLRTDWVDFNGNGTREAGELVPLPPLPRLPVSPTLAYFGDLQ
jgi:hypothetical protein